jgi:alpha-L-fucosidase
MFNVGPDGSGSIPIRVKRNLELVGAWIAKHSNVIKGAGASPWGHALPWGDVTIQGDKMYCSIFEWPRSDRLYLPGLSQEKVEAISAEGQSLESSWQDDWLIIDLTKVKRDPLISVIEIEFQSSPSVKPDLGLSPESELVCGSLFAQIENTERSPFSWMEKYGEWKKQFYISPWSDESIVTWEVNVYRVLK